MQGPACYFYFSGGGLRVFNNSDIFDKSRPPLGFKNPQIEIGVFLCFPPHTHYGIFPKFFRIKLMTPPLNLFSVKANIAKEARECPLSFPRNKITFQGPGSNLWYQCLLKIFRAVHSKFWMGGSVPLMGGGITL